MLEKLDDIVSILLQFWILFHVLAKSWVTLSGKTPL